jgi:prolyl-tRNA synthetase
MRLSHALIRTQRHVAAEASQADLPSHQLILKAGLARRLASGIYSLTPLAFRALLRIEAIVREEMARIDGQEVLLPVVQPAELWRETGRYDAIGGDLARLEDRAGHPMVLAMTHEEAVTDLARSAIDSYRQLPQMVFQLQTKFRDEPRPRGGLVRLREFLMKDAYSFHASAADLDAYYERVVAAYLAIFRRVGLPVLVVESDTGIMGGKSAHEFMLLADGGEDTLIVCPTGDYAANQEIAVADKRLPGSEEERAAPLEALRTLRTPGATTIAALCASAGVQPFQTLKSVFYTTTGRDVVLALVRGDFDVSAIKLRNLLHAELRALSTEEAAAAGLVAGYSGPVGLHLDAPLRIVADESVLAARNLVAGANRSDEHLAGVTYGRDFTAELVGEIAVARAGMPCARCGMPLAMRRGIEAANTFKLGTRYSAAMGATFRADDGESRPLVMGCYGVGLTRILACILEEHRDADGIIWPASVAPYTYHLLAAGNDAAAARAAEQLYATLGAESTLYDDRELSAGVKLKDADLLGMPLRITVSARSLAAGGAELRARRTGKTRIVALDEVPRVAGEMAASLA